MVTSQCPILMTTGKNSLGHVSKKESSSRKWNVVNVALLALPGVVDFSLFFISWPVYPTKQSYKIFYPLCSTY